MEDHMSKQLSSQIDIEANPEQVWGVLIDLPAYAAWNPFLVRADGEVQEGSRLTIRMQPVGARAVTFKPVVLEATAGRRLRWLGKLGMSGIFDGEHEFSLEAREGGGTRLSQNEEFRGLLVPLMARSLDRHTLPAFDAMNAALKHRAEQAARSQRD
jgi:hypothetical protein